jgi:hypothetical protein
MARRAIRIVLATLTLNAALLTGTLSAPTITVACSCVRFAPSDIGTYKDDPGTVVFVGTVQSMNIDPANEFGHSRGQLQVDLVFHGDIPSTLMPVEGGGGGDCTMHLEAGQRMITAAGFDGVVITPRLCSPYGDPITPDGQELIAEAVKAYGPGVRPPDAPPLPTDPPASPNPAADTALPLIVASIVGVVIALFGAVALLARRRPGTA